MRQLDTPELARAGSCEGALLVSEELVLEKRLGNRRAIDGHEGTLGARRQLMNGTSQKLLARAALPEDQDGGIGRRDTLNLKQRFLQTFARPHQTRQGHPLLQLLFQQIGATLEPPTLECAIDEQEKVVYVHRLGEEVRSALADGAHRVLDGAKGGHHDDIRFGASLQSRRQNVESTSRGQLQVGENDAETRSRKGALRLIGIGARLDTQSVSSKRVGDGDPERFLVLDQKDVNHRSAPPRR